MPTVRYMHILINKHKINFEYKVFVKNNAIVNEAHMKSDHMLITSIYIIV